MVRALTRCALVWLAALPAALAAQKEPLQIGVLDGPDEFIFAFVNDLAVDSLGRLVIVDRMTRRVRAYSLEGKYLGQAGRNGQGPGELHTPVALDVSPAGEVHVVDPGNARIAVFQITDEGLVPVDDQRTDALISDLCIAGDRRFALDPHGDLLFVELDSDGQVLRRFGPRIPAEGDLSRAFRSWNTSAIQTGPVECSDSKGLVAHVSGVLGLVRVFSFDGELLWASGVPDFVPVELGYVERMGACCSYSWSDRGFADSALATWFNGEELLVSVQRGPLDPTFRTVHFDARAGTVLGVDSHDALLSAHAQGRAIGYTTDPFPRLLIW